MGVRNRRLAMVAAVLIMATIAFAMRQDGLLPEGWTPRPRMDSSEEADEVLAPDEPHIVERPRRRSRTPRHGRLQGPPLLAESREAADSVHGEINGQVVDQVTAAPIPNASLTFRYDEQLLHARSDDEGRFRFAAPNEGAFTLDRADAEGYFSYASASAQGDTAFVMSSGRSVDAVRIRLAVSRRVRVVVHGLHGARAASQVRLLNPAEGPSFYDAPEGEVLVPAREGSVIEATSLEPRTLGHAQLRASDILAGVLHIHTSTLTAHNGTLHGQVLSLLGSEPLSGAYVEVLSENAEGNRLVAQLTSDADGHFVYEGDAPGPFSLRAQAAGFATESRTHTTRDAPVVLLLSEEASVVGRVLDDEGNPVPSFVVFAEAHVGALERHLRAQGRTFAASGEFRLGGLSSGGYTISVVADGFAPLMRDVLLSRGDSARPQDFRLRRGAVISGLVHGADGVLLDGVHIRVESTIAGVGLPISRDTQSDDEGMFRVQGLSTGRVRLTLTAPGHHPRVITVHTGGDQLDVTLNEVAAGEEPHLELAGTSRTNSPEERHDDPPP